MGSHSKTSNPMWGGQFAEGPDALLREINVSLPFDKALYSQDIQGSHAHAQMLAKTGIITKEEAAAITDGLKKIHAEIEAGTFPWREELEDIHMNVEARLKELIGDAAGKLHTARSRNDQVITDLRLWVRDAIDALAEDIRTLQLALVARAEEEAETIMPGFTHLQTAQPVTLGHHLLAYVEMLARDAGRLADCHARVNECPLGAAALAGTSFPIDRVMTAKELGFDAPMKNSLDAVASRDFVVEFLSACAISAMHLSRLAEELVLWSSPLVGFIRFSDAFSTGSSIMPQKRNPDAAELVRGKTGRIYGHLMALLTVLKGLPLAYNKDAQEDKEPVFDAAKSLSIGLRAMAGMIGDFTTNKDAMKRAAGDGYSTATDLADWLVQNLGLPFREAHHITARIVKRAASRHTVLELLPLSEMQAEEPRITDRVFAVLGVENSVKIRKSLGGTAPGNVRAQVKAWKEKL